MAELAALKSDLSDLKTNEDPATLLKKSRDFYWYSPILKRQLDDVVADLIVAPQNEAEVVRILKACYAHDVPVTVRGGGTGNYGQAMPLSGGVLLDMSDMNAIKEIKSGSVIAEAGANMWKVDRTAKKETGQELRLWPSTVRSSSIAGFIAGGSGGIGSINWGGLREHGNILGMRIVTMESEPRILELSGMELHKVSHAYGTNGIITEIEMPLTASYDWIDVIVGFDSFHEAIHYGNKLGLQDGLLKKLITPISAPAPQEYFARHKEFVPAGKHVVLVMIAPHAMDGFLAFTGIEQGEILMRSDQLDPKVAKRLPPIFEYSWNHTTLRALQVDPNITYLQVMYPYPNHLELVEKMANMFADELIPHTEVIRFAGRVVCNGLPMIRFTTEERLEEIMRLHEENGCPIFNPHRYTLEEGGMKQTDSVQLEFKKQADPKGLLNPGKMIAWDNPDFDFNSSQTYLFPGLAAIS